MKQKNILGSVLVAFFLLTSLAGSAVTASGEVLVLHFDEGSGSIARDASGYGNDGTIYGATWVDGISGKALSFDGSGDYVSVLDSASFALDQEITVQLWVKSRDVAKRYPNIFVKGTPHDLSFSVRLFEMTGQPFFQVWTSTGYYRATSPEALMNDRWYHIAGTYDGSSIKLFVDGVLKAEKSWSGNIVTNNHALVMGTAPAERGYEYLGLIDEVAIYSRALTADEIKTQYLALAPPTPTPTPTPTPAPIPSKPDSDGDGWSDEKEREMGTNPYSIDSDSDGLNDPEDPNPTVPEEQKGIPGFEVVFVIAGLATVAYLLRRRE